jgi:hypothetical protein
MLARLHRFALSGLGFTGLPFDRLRPFDKLRMIGPFDKLRANGVGDPFGLGIAAWAPPIRSA